MPSDELEDALNFAIQAIKNRARSKLENLPLEKLQHVVTLDPEAACDYAQRLRYRKYGWSSHRPFRWEPGEKIISTSAEHSFKYADDVLCGRFEVGEPAISKDDEYALRYAKEIIKGRWEMGEPAIASDPETAAEYASEILDGRFPLGEAAISTDAESSYVYACTIRERFLLGEEAISQSTEYMYHYAKDVCEGQLPDELHNKMVMLSFSEPDEWVRKYTCRKKYMVKKRRKIAS